MDRGAWRATIHRVAKSQTRLKQLGMHRADSRCTAETNTTFQRNYPPFKNRLKNKILPKLEKILQKTTFLLMTWEALCLFFCFILYCFLSFLMPITF